VTRSGINSRLTRHGYKRLQIDKFSSATVIRICIEICAGSGSNVIQADPLAAARSIGVQGTAFRATNLKRFLSRQS